METKHGRIQDFPIGVSPEFFSDQTQANSNIVELTAVN